VTVRTEAAPRPRLTGRAALLLIVLTVLAVFSTVPVREYLSQRSRIAELERQTRRLQARREQQRRKRSHQPVSSHCFSSIVVVARASP